MAQGIALPERFWSKVNKTETCWLWTASTRNGYGVLGWTNKNGTGSYAHRLSYQAAYGPVPDGLCVLHHCDVRRCVRPDHLFVGTRAENSADMVAKGRSCKGERQARSKLTVEQVQEIRVAHTLGDSGRSLAERYACSQETISEVIHRKRWGWVD
jgi:hypothetical protein